MLAHKNDDESIMLEVSQRNAFGGVSPPSPKRKAEKEQRGVNEVKISMIVVLVVLTLTVAAYNYQFHNIPSSMFLNAYKLSEWEVPSDYVDVTEDSGFRTWVIDYVIAGDTIRTGIKIEEHDLPYFWLKNASNSSKSYDMTIKFFDDFYFLQVRYYPDFQRTQLEHGILWTINIVTLIAWVFAIQSLREPLKKWRMRK